MSLVAYDRKLTVGSTVIGLMLAKDEHDRPLWDVHPSPKLAASYNPKQASYINYNPLDDLVFEESDWREGLVTGGFGGDDRFRSRIFAPPQLQTLARETGRHCVLLVRHRHNQRGENDQGHRQLEPKGGADSQFRLELNGATQLANALIHDIESHTTTGERRHLTGRRESGVCQQSVQLRSLYLKVVRDQGPASRLLLTSPTVHSTAVIADLNYHARPLAPR